MDFVEIDPIHPMEQPHGLMTLIAYETTAPSNRPRPSPKRLAGGEDVRSKYQTSKLATTKPARSSSRRNGFAE